MSRDYYGVRLPCGSHLMCYQRSTADRVRRVVRAWIAAGHWAGWQTLENVATLAAARIGCRTSDIIAECVAIYEQALREQFGPDHRPGSE